MRERAVFFAVLIAAAALAAVLVMSRADRSSVEPADAPSVPSEAASGAPIEEPAPPPSSSASASPSADAEASPALPAYVRVNPESAAACPEEMVLVDGIYCPFVGHRCSRFASEADDVCEAFEPDVICEGRLQKRRFCIDVYEYPNLRGVRPAMMIEFDDAKRACALEGKRLCTVEEWEFACEGTQMWPYPYGIERDSTACNIDQPDDVPDLGALADPRAIAEAVERADKRAPSGERDRCISPFGVRDMTGNVDEWTEDLTAKIEERPSSSAVKGGSWGRVRARCRPIGAPPPPSKRSFAIGFRCCSETKAKDRPMSVAPENIKLPRRRAMDRGR